MKAWVLHGVNDIRYEEVPCPVPDKGEVLIQVKAAGICGSDIPRIYDTGAHKHPIIIGHEFSGRVVSTGCDAAAAMEGRRVGIFPLIPCGECETCAKGLYEMCRNYNYLGSRCNGAFAEYVTAPLNNVIELPERVSYEEAAMLEPMAVAVHAMRRGTENCTMDREASVAVCGLGTIGMLLVMFLVDAGYKNIYAIGNKDAQKRRLLSLGIAEERYIDSRSLNPAEYLNEHISGADLFFECVGNNKSISVAVDSIAPAGRLVLVGNPHSDIELERRIYWKLLRNQVTVTGTWNSTYNGSEDDDWHYVLDRLNKHSVSPDMLITHSFRLQELETGLRIMRDKSEDYCKVCVVM